MAVTFSMSATVQDADAPDLRAALKLRYASNGIPNPTDAQLRAAMETEWRGVLANWTVQYRRDNEAISSPPVT